MIVYRGQYSKDNITLLKSDFISTSKDERIANSLKGKCCLFTINLINVPVIDVNETIKNLNKKGQHTIKLFYQKTKKMKKK